MWYRWPLYNNSGTFTNISSMNSNSVSLNNGGGTGVTYKSSSPSPVSGSYGYLSIASAGNIYPINNGDAFTSGWPDGITVDAYFYFPSLPTTSSPMLFNVSYTRYSGVGVSTDGRLTLWSNNSIVEQSSASLIPTATWFRASIQYDATDQSFKNVNIYKGTNINGTTPDWSSSVSAPQTTGENGYLGIGKPRSVGPAAGVTFYVDDIFIGNKSDGTPYTPALNTPVADKIFVNSYPRDSNYSDGTINFNSYSVPSGKNLYVISKNTTSAPSGWTAVRNDGVFWLYSRVSNNTTTDNFGYAGVSAGFVFPSNVVEDYTSGTWSNDSISFPPKPNGGNALSNADNAIFALEYIEGNWYSNFFDGIGGGWATNTPPTYPLTGQGISVPSVSAAYNPISDWSVVDADYFADWIYEEGNGVKLYKYSYSNNPHIGITPNVKPTIDNTYLNLDQDFPYGSGQGTINNRFIATLAFKYQATATAKLSVGMLTL